MQSKFYTVSWIKEVFDFYKNSQTGFFIEGKEVRFGDRDFFYALCHIYQKNLLLKFPFVDETALRELRETKEFDFMYFVDMLRKEFALWFRELVSSRDFSYEERHSLALEFLLLEEQVRKQVQIPLLDHLKKFATKVEALKEVENPQEKKELEEEINKVSKKAKRIYRIFERIESLEPSLSSEIIRQVEGLRKHWKEEIEREKFPIDVSKTQFFKELSKKVEEIFNLKR